MELPQLFLILIGPLVLLVAIGLAAVWRTRRDWVAPDPLDDVDDEDDGRPPRTWPGFVPLPLDDRDDAPPAVPPSAPALNQMLELFGVYVTVGEIDRWRPEQYDDAWEWLRDATAAGDDGESSSSRPPCLQGRTLDELLVGTKFRLLPAAAARMTVEARRKLALWAIAERHRQAADTVRRFLPAIRIDRLGGR